MDSPIVNPRNVSELPDERLCREAIECELATLSCDVRQNPELLDSYLAADFHEFGASGGQLWKAGTAELVAASTSSDSEPLEPVDFNSTAISDSTVLLTYTLNEGSRVTNRSSLWRKRPDGHWELFHHQGTIQK